MAAPRLGWSSKRAKQVIASTTLGLLIGGLGLVTKRDPETGDSENNGDVVASCMTAGMWGGFALGVLLTRDQPPDPKSAKPAVGAPTKTVAPWAWPQGQVGVMAAGSW